jgi:hypothetical protein
MDGPGEGKRESKSAVGSWAEELKGLMDGPICVNKFSKIKSDGSLFLKRGNNMASSSISVDGFTENLPFRVLYEL